MRKRDAHQKLSVGMIMTEFGASEDTKFDLVQLSTLANLADRNMQSWMYWQFKYYQDITTCTPEGETLYTAEGTVCEDKLNILSRAYPQAVAGTLEKFAYNEVDKHFRMSWTGLNSEQFAAGKLTNKAAIKADSKEQADQADDDDKVAYTSEIYVNRELAYRHGLQVKLQGAGKSSFTFQCPSIKTGDKNVVKIVQTIAVEATSKAAGDDEKNAMTVEISPCAVAATKETCTCL